MSPVRPTPPSADGYRFLLLGRPLERVDMTVRLLLSRGREPANSSRLA